MGILQGPSPPPPSLRTEKEVGEEDEEIGEWGVR